MSVGAIIGGVAAVAGAGASIYGASQAGGDAPPPVQTDPGKALLKYLKGLDKGLPQLQQMEGQYRPIFGDLNIADQQQYLNALLGMGSQANTAASSELQAARAAELANMRGNTGDVLSLLGGINPAGQQAAQNATTLANQAYARTQGPLSMQDARSADQTAREAFAARGRVNDNAGVAAEVLGREDVMAARRAEASSLGSLAAQLNAQYTDPALSILMGTPASTALGRDYVTSAQGIIGQNGPQFINPDAGINMGMQQASNLNAYNLAQAQQRQQSGATWASAGNALLGLAGNYYGNK